MTSRYDSSETEQLLAQVSQGDASALDRLVDLHRDYLRRTIELRMDEELRSRVDPSDVVQETQLAVSQRIDDFLRRRSASFRIWVRSTALERLADSRRRHLAEKRSVRREIQLSDASSLAIARRLLVDRPSQVLQLREMADQVRAAIEQLGKLDREVLLLRHVEELSNSEVAELLSIDPATARKRHGRAIRRLGEVMASSQSDPPA